MLIKRVIFSFALLAFAMAVQAGNKAGNDVTGSCKIRAKVKVSLPADASLAPTVDHNCARVKKGEEIKFDQRIFGQVFMVFTGDKTPFDGRYVLRMKGKYKATQEGTFPYMIIDTKKNNKRPVNDPVIVVDP